VALEAIVLFPSILRALSFNPSSTGCGS